ncbi:mannose-6-phosphate isomerase, class I [Brachybacterium vulturis]|uniref:mannose-6-phosphate isomerase n=1 Tax=Brachybacterium vulturis TaxID=2017484 RepID=A0A291GSE6_9MICO|nr:mannose-6-phosphate isomerase, class I [Brachybacterium vulturis]ATG53050.1 mannose-6-phosphate isomerase, class I [Brachybacterium vulturis]
MFELGSHLQHYAWGSATAIPEFLGREADGAPWAEAWFGAHPLAPASTPDGTGLDTVIAVDPEQMLGADVSRAFGGQLPFLLKVIAAERPLSLQVHPTREHAAESFAAESAAGIDLHSPLRSYRDANHKPEMLIALTPFTALCGFRTPRRAAVILDGLGTALTDRLHTLLVDNPTAHGMRAAFRTLVSASLRPASEAVDAVVEACRARIAAGSSPSPRIDRSVSLLAEHHPGDPGVVAALLLNPVSLQRGEAMYVPAGALHAYLHGTGLEVMATSDNVLRAGLTQKRVDADEVLQCVSVTAAPPLRVAPERQNSTSIAYYAPVDDFELAITELSDPVAASARTHPIPGSGPRIVLGLEGTATLETTTGSHALRAGQAVFVPAADGPLRARGHGSFAQASVP